MATKKQTAANRRNARKSTGPTTPQGKATASMNNLRHGLRARTVILPGEKQDVDSGRCRSAFRNDVDQDYELMPITIPTRCRSQIG